MLVLELVALQAQDDTDQAVQRLLEALELAEPDGFIPLFVDEKLPMAQLLAAAAAHERILEEVGKLLACLALPKNMVDTSASTGGRTRAKTRTPEWPLRSSLLEMRKGECFLIVWRVGMECQGRGTKIRFIHYREKLYLCWLLGISVLYTFSLERLVVSLSMWYSVNRRFAQELPKPVQ